ncbi:MAG: glycosyltransferase [Ilumatobacteraceae bacterium]|nr:glycosyltransferase [Ilumatobacteraceae bacterium]
MHIVFHGNAYYGSTSVQRAQAFRQLGHTVTFVPKDGGCKRETNFYRRVRFHLGYPCEVSDENIRLLRAVTETVPDVVWIEKSLTIRQETLKLVKKLMPPESRLVCFSPDDMMNPANQSAYWRGGIPQYDVHVTTKTQNLVEFTQLGARCVVFMSKSFDPETHRPLELSVQDRQKYGSEVAFPGTYEAERGGSIAFLASQGIPVKVWGSGWSKLVSCYPSLRIECEAVFSEEYAKAINAAKIGLGFLRKANRDRQTARSVEIPACGAFMLAERTEEHQALFREDVEAVYFSSNEELVDKVRYYLANDGERMGIAQAGRQRCLKSGYSHASRLQAVLKACYSTSPADFQDRPFNQVWRAV